MCVCLLARVQGVCTCLYLCPLTLGIAKLCSIIKAWLLQSTCVCVCTCNACLSESDILGGVWVTSVSDVYSIQITHQMGCVCFLNVPHLCCPCCLPLLFSPQPPQPKTPEVLWSETDSAVFHLTDESFDSFLEEHPAVLVMFYAPCK